MGNTPLAPKRYPSRFEDAKRAYVRGDLTFEEFEALVTKLVQSRIGDRPSPLGSWWHDEGIWDLSMPTSSGRTLAQELGRDGAG